MSYRRPGPPRAAVWLLERLLPAAARDAVIGDLIEDFESRTDQRRSAPAWFWLQSLRLGGRYAWFRATVMFARATGRPGWGEPSATAVRVRGVFTEGRLTLRRLAHRPAFAVTAIVVLGLGLGATTAVFSVVDHVLLQPFPYRDPGRMVLLWNLMRQRDLERTGFAGPDVRYLQDHTTTLSGVASAFAASTNLTGEGEPVGIVLSWVTPNFFQVAGVEPVLGRGFRVSDQVLVDPGVFEGRSRPQGPLPAILSHRMWRQRYGAAPDVAGRLLHANGQTFRVIGVAPPQFKLLMPPDRAILSQADLWTLWPFPLTDMAPGPGGSMVALGRLVADVTLADAQRQLDSLAAARSEVLPAHAAVGFGIEARPLVTEAVAHVSGPLLALFGAVSLVLLVAAVNVAGLVVARGIAREKEFALRSALGGSRWHLARQGILESLAVSVAGALVGVLLATTLLEVIRVSGPPTVPRLELLTLDVRALCFAATLAAILTLAVGAIPALQVSHTSPGSTLAGRSVRGRPSSTPLRRVLVVLQVAASVVLLVGAAAVLRQFVRLVDADPGFEPRGVLAMQVALPFFAYPTMASRADFMAQLADSLKDVDGVETVGGVSPIPFSRDGEAGRSTYADGEAFDQWGSREAIYRPMIPGFHEAVGIPLLAGRALTGADNAPGAPPVVVIDRRLQQAAWPSEEGGGVGKTLWVLGPHFGLQEGQPVQAEVVGVVGAVRSRNPTGDDPPTIYVPHRFWSAELMDFTIRAHGDPVLLAPAVRSVVSRLDPDLPVRGLRPLSDFLDAAKEPTRFVLMIVSVFAGGALLLSAVGLYGLLTFSVRQRTHELGVRMALGAEPLGLVRMVVRHGVGLATVGVVIGLVVAATLGSVVATMPIDLQVYGAVTGLVVLAATVASVLPARWATTVDPVRALKAD
jgi:putative ABC transport system permease protein